MSELEPKHTAVEDVAEHIRKTDTNYDKWSSRAEHSLACGSGILGAGAVLLVTGHETAGGLAVGVGISISSFGACCLSGAAHVSRHRAALTQALAQHELATGEIIEVYPEVEDEQAQSEIGQIYNQEPSAEA